MLKSILPSRKKSGSSDPRRRPFKEYHEEWFELLKNRHLPGLRRAMHESSVAQLSTHVDILRHHLSSYYDALDLSLSAASAADDVAHLLHPSSWRTPLETPFLWLGDLHPYLFTNLLRSFLRRDEDDQADQKDVVFQSANLRNRFLLSTGGDNNNNDNVNELFNRPWHIVMAWRNPPASLTARIDQIECGLRLMVPALAERARKAQERFVEAVAGDYFGGNKRRDKDMLKAAAGKAVMAEMDEMVGVLVDANRLRRSILAEIIAATSVYQAALFLEGLSQFLVGFRDPDLVGEFEACKTPLS